MLKLERDTGKMSNTYHRPVVSSALRGNFERSPRTMRDPVTKNTCIPVTRIERPVSIKHELGGAVDEFLAYFQRANRQLGFGATVGGLTMTYVPDKVLGKMLRDKYENYGRYPKQTAQIQRAFSKSFAGFRRSVLSAQLDEEWQGIYKEQVTAPREQPRSMPHNPLVDAWVDMQAEIAPDLRVLKGRYIAFDLSGNDVLRHEAAAIADFLEHDEGLDVTPIRNHLPDYVPHLTIARNTDNRLEHFGVSLPKESCVPLAVTLEKPQVYHALGRLAV